MDLKTLKALLQIAWCADTAYGEWNPNCPSLNQCAVTALVVQKYFGGKLPRCKMPNGKNHFWNILPGGVHVDLTEDQFEYLKSQPLKNEYIIRNVARTLSIKSTRHRYELLTERLEFLINLISKPNIPAI
jgi:hypothetical protein